MRKLLTGHWLLIAIIIIAAFLRFYNITGTPPGLYPDEAMNGNNALEALSAGHFKVFYPENNGREGLFMNIQAISLKILMPLFGGNPEPWMLRLVSALFGTLTVLGVYFLTKELFRNGYEIRKTYENTKNKQEEISYFRNNFVFRSGNIALLSSFLLAVSFWHINFSRIGFRAIMAPFFAVWAIYFLLKALNAQKYILNSVLGGILFGLGFYSYIAFRALPLLILVIWFIYWFKKPINRKQIIYSALIFTSLAILIFAPLGYYFLKNPQDFFGRTTQISIFNSLTPIKDLSINILKTAGMFNFAGDWNWRHNIAGRPLLFWPVGILFLIGIFLALKNLIQNLKFKIQNDNLKFKNNIKDILPKANTEILHFNFYILILWLIIAALPVIISNEGLPHALRSILLIPPTIILAGAGGVWLMSRIMNYELGIKNNDGRKSKILKFIIHTSLFIILSLFIFEAYYTYFILWAKNPNTLDAFNADYVWIAKGLNDLPKELPKYVVVEASGVDVRGFPMPTQTVMFITDTFTPEKQKEKNIHYVLPDKINEILPNSYVVTLK